MVEGMERLMARMAFRYMVRFIRVPRPLLGDWLNPECHDCDAPATTIDRKYGDYVCDAHAVEERS